MATAAKPLHLDDRVVGTETDSAREAGQEPLDVAVGDLLGFAAAPANEEQAGVRLPDVGTDCVGVQAFKPRYEAFGEQEIERAVDCRRIARAPGLLTEAVEQLIRRHRASLREQEAQDSLPRIGQSLTALGSGASDSITDLLLGQAFVRVIVIVVVVAAVMAILPAHG